MQSVKSAPVTLPRRLLAEPIGTGLLGTVVVGPWVAAAIGPGEHPARPERPARTVRGAVGTYIGAVLGIGLILTLYPSSAVPAEPAVVTSPSTIPTIQET